MVFKRDGLQSIPLAHPHRSKEGQNLADYPGHPGCSGPLPGLQPCRPLRRDRHAPGAAESPPTERPGRHAGVWVRCGYYHRDELCGGADEEVSKANLKYIHIQIKYKGEIDYGIKFFHKWL